MISNRVTPSPTQGARKPRRVFTSPGNFGRYPANGEVRSSQGRGATMRKLAQLSLLALLIGLVVGALGSQVLYAQQQAVIRTPLLQQDLVGLDGKEVNMYIADIAPGAQSGR